MAIRSIFDFQSRKFLLFLILGLPITVVKLNTLQANGTAEAHERGRRAFGCGKGP